MILDYSTTIYIYRLEVTILYINLKSSLIYNFVTYVEIVRARILLII